MIDMLKNRKIKLNNELYSNIELMKFHRCSQIRFYSSASAMIFFLFFLRRDAKSFLLHHRWNFYENLWRFFSFPHSIFPSDSNLVNHRIDLYAKRDCRSFIIRVFLGKGLNFKILLNPYEVKQWAAEIRLHLCQAMRAKR